MKKKLLITCLLVVVSTLRAQDYPFNLPANLEAKININTNEQEEFNNLLLGTNIHHFTKTQEKDFVNLFNPISVRFPHGLWSNWYDWRRDVTRLFGEEEFTYLQGENKTPKQKSPDRLANIHIFDRANIKVGIEGLTTLNSDRKTTKGKGYDMIWTFNMSADGSDFSNGSPESVARYQDLISRGFQVNDIEMGNECFYPGQRSSIIPNAEDYIARAKSMSAALKALDPNIRVSIPLLRRGSWANPNWNSDLTQDQTYFDAVTVHTYVGSDPDDASNSDEAYSTALTARKHLLASITDYAHKVAPTKPIWLTEWGVKSGGPNAVSALGAIDCFLLMSENQDVFERANWFSTNGKLNSMVVWETYFDTNANKEKERIKYPLEKTLFGTAYEITRSVLENSTLLESTLEVANLEPGVPAVSSRVVVKDGKTKLLVLNLSNQDVPYEIAVNNTSYNGKFEHKTIKFSNLGEERSLGFNDDPLSLEKEGTGSVTLPKLSINTIYLSDLSVTLSTDRISELNNLVVSPNPNNGIFKIALGEQVEATYNLYTITGIKVKSGKFYNNTEVHLSQYNAGMYVLEVTSNSLKAVKKIILR